MSAYLDGELPREERLSLESHLAACADCSRELAELKKVSAVFKKNAMEPVPHSLKDAVFAQKREKAGFSHWLKPVAAFAAAGALIMLALPKLREQEQTYSPALLQSAYRQEGSAPGRLAGNSAGAKGAPVQPAALSAGEGAAAGGGSPRYAVPSFSKRGAVGQAKFSAAARSKTLGAVSGAAASFSGESDGAGFFAAGSMKAKRAAPATAGKSEAPPKWLKDLIRQYEKGPQGNPALTVWEFRYKGKKVYYIPPQCCDQYSELYDEKGGQLCAPDGGMTGRGDGKCADFYELRKNGRLLWRDTRGGK